MSSVVVRRLSFIAAAVSLCLVASQTLAQPAPGYYSTVDNSSPQGMRDSLHEIIDDHQWIPYTDTSTDTWDVLEIADENQDNAGQVITVYRNAAYGKEGGGNSFYNREHSWPKSYGFPDLNSSNYPYTDMHHLFIADSGYNSSRSNKPFNNCGAACSEKATETNNGRGGLGGGYPGDSNWTTGSFTQGIWEVWNARKGDIARAMFYMDVRYAGGTHGITGVSEPDLILTDNLSLIENSNTGSNISVAYMGLLSTLLQWHYADPVDLIEFQHNEGVAAFQGNRNPFVDNPQWVACVFEFVCDGGTPDTTPPATPTGLASAGHSAGIDLDWFDNGEADLAGYHVYRSDTSGSGYVRLTGSSLANSEYSDSSAVPGVTYHYVVTAIDTSVNESAFSAEVSDAATGGGPGGPAESFINEFHYDNDGTDSGEFVEVAAPAGTNLNGWSLVGYNGNGGTAYKTVSLSGTVSDQMGCMGTASFAFTGLQNGSPDGIALIDDSGAVLDFVSYEGSMNATDGPAAGNSATDVGVSETSSTPVGFSLQRQGSGSAKADFTWSSPDADSPGQVNANQQFDGCTVDTDPPMQPTNLIALAGDGQVDLDWDDNIEADLAGYTVYRSTVSGSGFSAVNASLLTSSSFVDQGLVNGTTYYYVVTATDNSDNQSGFSSQSSATPTAPATTGNAWINELHYDNDGTDTGEFVEIAGEAGIDLTGWQLIAYNGNGGTVYATLNLNGSIADMQSGFGTLAFDMAGLQNGAPDGVALVDGFGDVIEFISYEGAFVASDGPAAGLSSTDIGVNETANTPIGYSLQRTGAGLNAGDFVWAAPQSDTYASVNAGQSFGSAPPADTTPPAAPTGLYADALRSKVNLSWDGNTEQDLAGYNVYRSTTSGSGYQKINAGLISGTSLQDSNVANLTYYYYVVTAVDTSGNESAMSDERFARPAKRNRDRREG